MLYVLVVILVLVVVILWLCKKPSTEHFTVTTNTGYGDKKQAEELLREIVERVLLLRKYLKLKYKIAVEPTNDSLNEIDIMGIKQPTTRGAPVSDKIYMHVTRMMKQFDPNSLHELDPNNAEHDSAYTEGKGEYIALCIRDAQGKLHDINTAMYVMLHELSHVIETSYGHVNSFWDTFKWLLQEAVEIKVYEPVDYKNNPITYCGLKLTFNPLFNW